MFRPLRIYRQIEDAERGDKNEGIYSRNVAGLKIGVDWAENGNYVHAITVTVGNFDFFTQHDDQIHIVCFTLLPQPQFGPVTIEIFKPLEFLQAAGSAFDRVNAKLKYGILEYYDLSHTFNGPPRDEIWLLKAKSYSHQSFIFCGK